jgi:hypothetical protein
MPCTCAAMLPNERAPGMSVGAFPSRQPARKHGADRDDNPGSTTLRYLRERPRDARREPQCRCSGLLDPSDPKITERRYTHFSPDFMAAEVNRLRFGLAPFAPSLAAAATSANSSGGNSQALAALGQRLGTSLVQPGPRRPKRRPGARR